LGGCGGCGALTGRHGTLDPLIDAVCANMFGSGRTGAAEPLGTETAPDVAAGSDNGSARVSSVRSG
jgi:hypothetical protein